MNIIQVMGMHASKFGGLEKFMLSLAKNLHTEGHKLIIIYESEPANKKYIDELNKYEAKIIIIPSKGLYAFYFLFSFFRLLLKFKPEIVHCHFNPAGYIALIASWILGIKKRYKTIHSMLSVKNIEIHNQNELPIKTIVLMKLMYLLSTQIFSVSEQIKGQFYHVFRVNKKIQTLYLGVEDINFNKELVLKKYNLPLNKIIITCVAFHDDIKGIDILLESISLLKKKYNQNNILLCQIGGDDLIKSNLLINLANKLEITEMINWMGIQNNVPEILSVSDIYCQPSRSEGISLAIMEASMASLSTVASNVGGIPEAVKDNISGFLFEKENIIQLTERLNFLISNKDERRQMGINAKQLALQNFEINQQVNKLISSYLDR